MKKNYLIIPLLLAVILFAGIMPVHAQVTITQWNFDQQSLTPSTGGGTATTTGGITGSYATGNPNLYAWSTTGYPVQGTASGTAGVQFSVSTLGFNNIVVSWENRNSNTAANRTRLKYTLNGNDWIDFEATSANATNINDGSPAGFDAGRYVASATDWFFRSADFSAVSGANQNPNFAIKLVTEFADGIDYAGTAGAYATDGTIRFENVTFSGTAGSPTPVITSVLMPQFMSGNTPSNTRLPFAFRATISYLLPSTTYRYINMAVTGTDNATSAGAGAIIYVNSNGTFTRSAVGSFTNAGEYGEFTTDGSGNYTGWFITEPTTNTRFTPGNQVFMRIRLNDGNDGTAVAHYLTIAESVTVLGFSEGNTGTDGTAIRGESMAAPKNFSMLYDNEAGTGRPLCGTSVESTGIDFSTLLYASFFQTSVAGVNGAWGGIVPNVNALGVKRVEERSLANGTIVNANTSPDGMWGTTNTVNPTGGITNVLVLDLTPLSEITVTPTTLTGFSYLLGTGPSTSQTYTISATELVGTGNIAITAPASYEISNDGISWLTSMSLPFAGGVITNQPVTIHVRLKAGLAIGNYNNEPITHSGGYAPQVNVTCSGQVTAPAPVLASEVPAYIQGINGTNSQRVPLAFYMSINNLVPEATYRYYNSAVLENDLPNADGAGTMIIANSTGIFSRSEAPTMTAGYGELTADETGVWSGWLMIESTGDARFTPGNSLYMRVMLNNGNGGTTCEYRLTTTTAASVINFGTDNDPDTGTGIRAVSASSEGNMIYLFSNEAGTGRPLYATSIETTGIDYTVAGSYVGFYTSDVEGNSGSWGGIVPNVLPSGIQRIEERSLTDGSIVTFWTSADGVWGETDTRNPVGGEANELVLDLLPPPVPTIIATPDALSGFSYIEQNGPSVSQSYLLTAENLEGSGNIEIVAPAGYEISLDDVIYSVSLQVPFADGIITAQPVTVYTRLIAGQQAGTVNGTITNAGGGTSTMVLLSGEVQPPPQPQLSNVLLPIYIQGGEINNNRVPMAFRATIENLNPSSTYRYYNKAVVESDEATYTGVGYPILVNADGTFARTTGNSLGTPGQYGEFITDNDGNYTGWFMLEPVNNQRFAIGNQLYMRVMINDGNEGTDIDKYLTSADYTTVLEFTTEPGVNGGTAIRGTSYDASGDFVFLYNSNERPLFGTSIETTGIDFGTTGVYAPFYSNIVAGQNGSWGGIVPNTNAEGVQIIKVYSNENRSLVNTYGMPTGVWGMTDTRNPAGGVGEVLFINLQTINTTNILTPLAGIWYTGSTISVRPTDSEKYTFTLLNLQGKIMVKQDLTGQREISINVPAGVYVARFMSNGRVYSHKLLIN